MSRLWIESTVIRVPAVKAPRISGVRLALPGRHIADALAAARPDVVHLASPFVLGAWAIKPAVRLDVPVDAYLPADYVPFEAAKIDLHRRIGTPRQRHPDALRAPRRTELIDHELHALVDASGRAVHRQPIVLLAGHGQHIPYQPAETLAGVKALATLPSLPEMRAKLLGTIVAPATRLATVIRAPAGQLARVVNAYAQKGAAG